MNLANEFSKTELSVAALALGFLLLEILVLFSTKRAREKQKLDHLKKMNTNWWNDA